MASNVGTSLVKACFLFLKRSLLPNETHWKSALIISLFLLCWKNDTYVPCWDVLKALASPQELHNDPA